jgi:hypothetical protein
MSTDHKIQTKSHPETECICRQKKRKEDLELARKISSSYLNFSSPANASTPKAQNRHTLPPPAAATRRAGMPKPAASVASLLPQLWNRPFPPRSLVSRALSFSPLFTAHRTPRHRRLLSRATPLTAADAVSIAAAVEAPAATA